MSTVSNVIISKEKKVRAKKAAPVTEKPATPKPATPKSATPKSATPKPATPKSEAEGEGEGEGEKPVKIRKPTLSAKYVKFVVFGYSVINTLVASGLVSDEQLDAAYAQIKLMESVEDQTSFYAGFLENLSASGKAMKKFVNDKKKPPKVPKERKPRAKKADKESESESDVKEKKPRAKTADKETKSESDSEVKEKKPRAKKSQSDSEVKEKKPRAKKSESDSEVKEKKPRAKKTVTVESDASSDVISNLVAAATNPSNLLDTHPHHDDDDDDDEIVHTRETFIDGHAFLIDQHNNLYDTLPPHPFLRTL